MERQLAITQEAAEDSGRVRSFNRRQGAFTLIELLVVTAVAGILITVAVPSMRNMLDSTNLTRAGQTVGDQVNLARQIASANSSTVEVRFLKIPKIAAEGYSAIQVWGANRKGTLVALRNVALLPQGMVISGNATLSPVFSSAFSQPLPTGNMPKGAGMTSGAAYVSFQVRPSGVVFPVLAMKDFCFTVTPARSASSGTLPTNYVAVQVNPLTASPFLYRP